MAGIYRPTLVVGLGGTGKKIILALKKMIAESSPNGMADYPFLKLLSLDTDVSIPPNSSSIETIEERDLTLDANKEVFPLSTDFVSIPDLAAFPEIQGWFPDKQKYMLLPAELKKGAGQKKPIGRFCFAWNATNLYNRLQILLGKSVDVNTASVRKIGADELSDTINVFICTSLSGGTGAGAFLDTAYMIRDISTKIGKTIYIFGLFALDTIFAGIQGDIQIKPNCYASLIELDHYSNLLTFSNVYQQFKPAYKNFSITYDKAAEMRPFDFPFLFDNTNQSGKCFNNLESFAEMAARFVYLLTGHTVASYYDAMDSNVRASIDQDYKKEFLNKPNIYRSMGVFSVVYPRRMIIQLCGYLLSQSYLSLMLNDEYKDYEIEKYTLDFLSRYKCNPQGAQLEEIFNTYTMPDGTKVKFSEYLTNAIDDFEMPKDKKEVIPALRDFFAALDSDLGKYKEQVRPLSKTLKDNFTGYLDSQLAVLTDLRKTEDTANEKSPRGSVKRAERFINQLINLFNDTDEKSRKIVEDCEARLSRYKSDFDYILDDIVEAINSLIPKGGKLKQLLDDALNTCLDYLECARKQLIHSHIRQFITNILDKSGAIDEVGILHILQEKKKLIRKIVNDFEALDKLVANTIAQNKKYDSGSFIEVVYNYEQDVTGLYRKLLKTKSEDFIFETISAELKKSAFGEQYAQIETMSSQLVLRNILRECEKLFFPLIGEFNIETRIMEDLDIRLKFENRNYLTNAAIFIGLDGQELSKVGLQMDTTRFFAITIPDTYTGKPCENTIKGSVGKKICPIDENPEAYRNDPCPKYGKCLKQILVANAPLNLAIIPCNDFSEVNIIQTIAGFPLHALFSAVKSARNYYLQLKTKYAAEQKNAVKQEEYLHMFGTVYMPDLVEKTEDTASRLKAFKKLLLAAYTFNWLKIERLQVAFFQEKDLKFKRVEPTLVLGQNIDEVLKKRQSNAVDDSSLVNQFVQETEARIAIAAKMGKGEKYIERLKKVYLDINAGTDIPPGFTMDEAELLDEFAKEHFNQTLAEENTAPDPEQYETF